MSGHENAGPRHGRTPSFNGGRMDRRQFLRAGLLAGAAVTASCGNPFGDDDRGDSRLRARLRAPTLNITPGVHDLFADTGVEGELFVPSGYDADAPPPLVVMLHGAGASLDPGDDLFPIAQARQVLMLAPEARGRTWDRIRGQFGPDVARIDRALEWTFERCAVDPAAVALAGFSDGGTYALSLGLDNGDLFTHLIAYSPGFLGSLRPRGKPRIYVAHGRNDAVLPIDRTSRVIVPRLEEMGYDVTYNEFDGVHALYASIMSESLVWLRPDRPQILSGA